MMYYQTEPGTKNVLDRYQNSGIIGELYKSLWNWRR